MAFSLRQSFVLLLLLAVFAIILLASAVDVGDLRSALGARIDDNGAN